DPITTVTLTVPQAAPGTITLRPDPCHPGATALVVNGTPVNDTIVIGPGNGPGTLRVTINGSTQTVTAPTGRGVVFGYAGNDDIQVAGGVAIGCWLYGGAGNDRLKGGAGHNVLVGCDGDDLLVGGGDRDLLIGGRGADRLVGNADEDIIIAGYTAYDGDDA